MATTTTTRWATLRICGLVAIYLVAVLASSANAAVCRVAAFSGGGDRVAYQVGVINAFATYLNTTELRWNVVTGISAGSITATVVKTFNYGEEVAMASFMKEFVSSITKDQVLTNWPGGILDGLLSRRGIFDSAPLLSLLKTRILSRPFVSDRRLIIGATSAQNGEMAYWSEKSADLASGILASSTIPGVLPAVTATSDSGVEDIFLDGGVKQPIIFKEGIEACRKMGYTDSQIIIDAFLCDPMFIPVESTGNWTSLSYLMKSMNIGRYYRLLWIFDEVKKQYPSVQWRYVVSPSRAFPGSGADFKPRYVMYVPPFFCSIYTIDSCGID